MTPEQLHGTERAEAWAADVQAAPRFGGYEEKADREMPIIRLRPKSEPTSPPIS